MSTLNVGSDQTYKTLADALAAANDGDVIVLNGDITESSVKIEKSVTIDLNNNTLTGKVYIWESAAVEIKNGKMTVAGTSPNFNDAVITTGLYTDAEGNVKSSGGASSLVLNKVDLNGGEAVNSRYYTNGICYKSTGGLKIVDSTITAGTATRNADCESIGSNSSTATAVSAPVGSAGDIVIENSTITGGYGKTDAEYTGYVSQLFSPGGSAVSLHGSSDVTITGSTVKGGSSNWYNAAEAINVSNQFSGTLSVVESNVAGGDAEGEVAGRGTGGVGIYTHMSTGCNSIDITGSTITGGDGGYSWNGNAIEYRNKNIQMNITDSTVAAGNGENASGNGAALSIYNSNSTQIVLDGVKLNGEGNGSNTVINGGDKGITVVGPVEVTGGELTNTNFKFDAEGFTGAEEVLSGATGAGVQVTISGNDDAAVVVDGGKTYVTTETDPAKADISTIYVDNNWADKEANALVGVGKFMGVNAFASILEATEYNDSVTSMVISGGEYTTKTAVVPLPDVNTVPAVLTDYLSDNITNISTDGEVIIADGNLVFETESGTNYYISGSFTSLKTDTSNATKPGVEKPVWPDDYLWTSNGQIQFVGVEGTVFNIDADITVSSALTFEGGSTIISKDSTIKLSDAEKVFPQVCIDSKVTNYGAMDLTIAEENGSLLNVAAGAEITFVGKDAVLTTQMKESTWASDVIVAKGGSLIFEDNASANINGLVTNNGSITTDGISFSAGKVANNGTWYITTDAQITVGTLTGAGLIEITLGDDFALQEGESFKLINGDDVSGFTGSYEIVGEKGFAVQKDAENGDINIVTSIFDVDSADELTAALAENADHGKNFIRISGKINVDSSLADAMEENADKLIFAEDALLLWPTTEVPEEFAAIAQAAPAKLAVIDNSTLKLTAEATGIVEDTIKVVEEFKISNTNTSGASEIRSDISAEDSENKETPVDVTIDNSGKELQITGSVTASGKVTINNDNKKTGDNEAVLNGGNNDYAAKIEAAEIEMTNKGHAVVDLKAAGKVTIKNTSDDTVIGTIDGDIVEITGKSVVNGDQTIEIDGSLENSTVTAKQYTKIADQNVSDSGFNGSVLIAGNTKFAGENTVTPTGTGKAAIKVVNGAVMTVEADSVVNVDGYAFVFAGKDSYPQSDVFAGADAEYTSAGTINIDGALNVNANGNAQVNVNAGGIINVNAGGSLSTYTLCVENGGIADATAGKMAINGDVEVKSYFNVFNGGSVTVNEGGNVLMPGWLNNINPRISIGTNDSVGTFKIAGGEVVLGENADATVNVLSGSVLEISGGKLDVQKGVVTNDGTFKVTGKDASTVKATITGKALQLENGVLENSEITGDVNVYGTNNTIRGENGNFGVVKVGKDSYTDSNASLNIVGKVAKMNLQVGDGGDSSAAKYKYNVVVGDVNNNIVTEFGENKDYGNVVIHMRESGTLTAYNSSIYVHQIQNNGTITLNKSTLTHLGNSFTIAAKDSADYTAVLNLADNAIFNAKSTIYVGQVYTGNAETALSAGSAKLELHKNSTINGSNLIMSPESTGHEVSLVMDGDSEIVLTGKLLVGTGAAITMDATSSITAGTLTGDGVITVNVAKDFSGINKVIDITGDGDAVEVAVTGNAKAYAVTDGKDTYVTTADKTAIMLDATATDANFGNAIDADGKFIAGVNAFDSAEEAINAMTAATKTIYVNGTVEGQWPVQGITIDKDLKFEAVNGAPATIIANGGMYGAAIAANMTLGAGVTLNTAPDQKTQNFCGYGADGKDITLDINGIWQNGGGDFGSYADNATGTVTVKVGSTGKFISVGLDNTSFLANSIVNVTGTGNAKTKEKMEEIQFVSGVNTSMKGKVDMVNTNVLFGGYTPYGNLAFSGDDSMTVSNSIFTVVCNTVIGIDENGQAVYRNDDMNPEIVYGNLTINKNATFTDSELNVANLMIGGKTFTVNGGVVNAHAAYWDDSVANGANANKNWTGDITIAEGTTLAMTNATLNAEGTVTNNGSVTVNGGTFTADAFAQNSSEQAVFNNVVMDVGSLDTGSNEWVVIGGKSKVMIDKLSGSNAVRFAAGTTLLDGTSIEGLGVRSLGALTVGEKATDTIYTYHYDTTRASVGTITVNGEWKIGKNNFGIATWRTGDAIKLTGAGTVNVDSQVFFEGYWPGDADFYTVKGDILIDEKLTINMVNEGDVASHLRFSYTDVTIKGIVANKGTWQNMTALCEADVIVTGNKAKLDLEGYLTIGNVYDIYNNTVTDAHKSSLTVSNGASVNAQNVFVNLDSKINVNNATFSVSTIDNNGIITISGNSTVNATVAGNAVTLAKNAVLAGNLNAAITVAGTASLAAGAAFAGSITSGTLKVSGDNVLNVTDSAAATLLAAAGDYSDDKFGAVAIKGATKNAELTLSTAALDGNMITNAKVNFTGIDNVTSDVEIAADVALSDIKTINGKAVKSINGVYFYEVVTEDNATTPDVNEAKVDTYILNKVDGGIDIVVADQENAPIFEGEQGNTSLEGDLSQFDITMKAGTTTLKVAKGKSAAIGNVEKSDNGGVTNISLSSGADLTAEAIYALGKLSTGTGAKVDLGLVDGTNLNTTISLGKDNEATIDSVDMKGGKNTLSIGARTDAEIKGAVDNVRTIKLASGKKDDLTSLIVEDIVNAPDMANSITLGNYASLELKKGLKNSDINVGTTIKVGKYSKIVAEGDMTYVAGLSIGAGSFFSAKDIIGTAGKNTFALGADMTGNGANKEVVIDSVDMMGGKNTFSIGARTDVVISGDLSNVSTLKLANGTYYKKTKKNPTAYTNETSLAMQNFTGVNATVAIGNYASFNAADMTGVSKLTLGKSSIFNAQAITGTEKNNTFTFNSNAAMATVDMGAGNDTFKLGANVEVNAAGLIFGEGTKDKLAFSKNASLVLTGDISGLESITGNKSNTIYLTNGVKINGKDAADVEDVKGLNKVNVVEVFNNCNAGDIDETLSIYNTADIFELAVGQTLSVDKVDGGSIKISTWDDAKNDWTLLTNTTIPTGAIAGKVKVELGELEDDKIEYGISIA